MNEKANQIISKIAGVFKGKNGGKIIIVLGICGILLIFLSTLTPGKSDTGQTSSSDTAGDTYIDALQTQLSQIVKDIAGAENATVFVTLDSGVEYVYANDVKESQNQTEESTENGTKTETNTDTEKNYVIVNSGSGDSALIITEMAPKVKGVVVVCEGGEDPVVSQKITDAVTTALGIPTMRVYVAGIAGES